MKKQVRLFDVFHWQLKRCVNGSLCESCSGTDSMSPLTEVESLSLHDDGDQPQTHKPLTYIAGVDISFIKNDKVNACAACIVVRLPDFDVHSFTLLLLLYYLKLCL